MEINDRDLKVLRALESAKNEHKELGTLLDFYYDLYQVLFLAKAGLPEPEMRDAMASRWRLEGGIPQLAFDQLGFDPEPFTHLVLQVMEVLHEHNPTWRVERADRMLEDLEALARDVFENWDTLTSPKPGSVEREAGEPWPAHPTSLAVGFALAPYLQRAAEVILPHLDLSLWAQGHCPVCGGRPNLALLDEESGARSLVCSRCSAEWTYARIGCPFCTSEERPIYYPSEDGMHRLYVCPACKRYLKTVDLRQARHLVLPMVERLLTVGMDLAARQEGYEG
jgi:FdhE protein